jgi:hypothetical protein
MNKMNPLDRLAQAERDSALIAWRAAAAEANQLYYASHVRDLAPLLNASARSIKIRTGKLRRFLATVTP